MSDSSNSRLIKIKERIILLTSKSFSFDVMCFHPKGLKFGVIMWTERMTFQDFIQFFEISSVEGDYGLGLQHGFIIMQLITSRQRP